jgi:hypothetical protein
VEVPRRLEATADCVLHHSHLTSFYRIRFGFRSGYLDLLYHFGELSSDPFCYHKSLLSFLKGCERSHSVADQYESTRQGSCQGGQPAGQQQR